MGFTRTNKNKNNAKEVRKEPFSIFPFIDHIRVYLFISVLFVTFSHRVKHHPLPRDLLTQLFNLCIKYSTSTSFVKGITKSLYIETTASTLIFPSPAFSPKLGSVPYVLAFNRNLSKTCC